MIARPILFGWSEYGSASGPLASIFFLTFVLVNSFILFNVFVAVLIEKMVQPDKTEEMESAEQASTSDGPRESRSGRPLDKAAISKLSARDLLESMRLEQDPRLYTSDGHGTLI